jgi:hypothetical protein
MPKTLSAALERKALDGAAFSYSRPNRAKVYQPAGSEQVGVVPGMCHAACRLVGLAQLHYVSASMLYGIARR